MFNTCCFCFSWNICMFDHVCKIITFAKIHVISLSNYEEDKNVLCHLFKYFILFVLFLYLIRWAFEEEDDTINHKLSWRLYYLFYNMQSPKSPRLHCITNIFNRSNEWSFINVDYDLFEVTEQTYDNISDELCKIGKCYSQLPKKPAYAPYKPITVKCQGTDRRKRLCSKLYKSDIWLHVKDSQIKWLLNNSNRISKLLYTSVIVLNTIFYKHEWSTYFVKPFTSD